MTSRKPPTIGNVAQTASTKHVSCALSVVRFNHLLSVGQLVRFFLFGVWSYCVAFLVGAMRVLVAVGLTTLAAGIWNCGFVAPLGRTQGVVAHVAQTNRVGTFATDWRRSRKFELARHMRPSFESRRLRSVGMARGAEPEKGDAIEGLHPSIRRVSEVSGIISNVSVGCGWLLTGFRWP